MKPLTLRQAWDLLRDNDDHPRDWGECDGEQVVRDAADLFLQFQELSQDFVSGLAAGFRLGLVAAKNAEKEG